jgi:hypothetical protein
MLHDFRGALFDRVAKLAASVMSVHVVAQLIAGFEVPLGREPYLRTREISA